jgi:hypothetical protein
LQQSVDRCGIASQICVLFGDPSFAYRIQPNGAGYRNHAIGIAVARHPSAITDNGMGLDAVCLPQLVYRI